MKRFWTSTGLCPPEPRNASGAFLLSKDSLTNLELIGSLPNRGISHVRIHWLLDLLEVCGLYPAFELMGIPQGMATEQPCTEAFWIDLVQQLVGRYTDRYSLRYVAEWRFETWNEPDLRSYNQLNFTTNDYLSYAFAIRKGMSMMNLKFKAAQPGNGATRRAIFPLYGPAGLFKSLEHHPLCWSALEVCNSNVTDGCPFDTITFHRKGSGRWASEVLDGGRQLLNDVLNQFPNLKRKMFANDEADPIAGWSTGRPFQADVRYGAMLFSIVAQHWSAIANRDEFGQRFQFLSHDNAFLSYYPYVFEQRTLFARFQMNLTNPPHVRFVVKPAFSALGMLANLAPLAVPTRQIEGNVSYITSVDERSAYLCLVASRSNDSFPMWRKRLRWNVSIPTDIFAGTRTRLSYLVEAIQDGRNDPFQLWQMQGKPPYPTAHQLAAMREVQLPSVLKVGSHNIDPGKVSYLKFSFNLRAPWIVSVRVCSEHYPPPAQIYGVRVRSVYRDEVLITWKLSRERGEYNRCIQTYEVWFKSSYAGFEPSKKVNRKSCSGMIGYYKVRAVDLHDRKGPFSTPVHYKISA
uniref:Uncharacterized protein n=1 Tax=Anopheles epiroticus TaxID=199890 RepID=A0A182PJK7_9DIPT